jgi:glycosyltransferase involved in cell wall biosynthesis
MGYKPWRMAVWLAQMARIPFNRLLPPTDVYHATEHLLMPLRGIPTVLTIHDLIFKLFPEHHKRLNYWYLNAAMPLFVRRADAIIAISEATKRDLMDHHGTPEEKITVIYEAAAPHFTPQSPQRIAAVRAKYNLPPRYLLTVGTIEPRKNLARLVEALTSLRADDPDLRLVVVGSEGWLTESFHAAIDQHGQHEAVIRPGFIPDDDLPAIYAGAAVAVSASLYEGFGLPILEAMACGAPVACSSTSSLGEIAGDAALTFHPERVAAIYEVIHTLLHNDPLRADLRERGLARAAEFSWERAARETWAVYEKVFATEIRRRTEKKTVSHIQ